MQNYERLCFLAPHNAVYFVKEGSYINRLAQDRDFAEGDKVECQVPRKQNKGQIAPLQASDQFEAGFARHPGISYDQAQFLVPRHESQRRKAALFFSGAFTQA